MFARDEIKKTLEAYDKKNSYLNCLLAPFYEPPAITCLRAINKDFHWVHLLQFLIKFNAENKLATESTTSLLAQVILELIETLFGENYPTVFSLLMEDQNLDLLLKIDYRTISDERDHSFTRRALNSRCLGLHSISMFFWLLEGRQLLTWEVFKKMISTVEAHGVQHLDIIDEFIGKTRHIYEDLTGNQGFYADGIKNFRIIGLIDFFQTLKPTKDYLKLKKNMNVLSEIVNYYHREYNQSVINLVLEHFLGYPHCDSVYQELTVFKYGSEITSRKEEYQLGGRWMYSIIAEQIHNGMQPPNLLELKKKVDLKKADEAARLVIAKDISCVLGQVSRSKDNKSCFFAMLPDEILKEEIYPRAVQPLNLDSEITKLALNTFFYKKNRQDVLTIAKNEEATPISTSTLTSI